MGGALKGIRGRNEKTMACLQAFPSLFL